jgi:Amt family ammonium transporter
MDFAGSGMVHMLAGGAAVALVLLARVCSPAGPGFAPQPGSRALEWIGPKLSPIAAVLFLLGALIFILLIVGVNAGSVLSSDAPVVAAVLNATTCAVAGGLVASAAVSMLLARRSRLLIVVSGALAGWAAVCGPADSVNSVQALSMGLMAGGLGTCLLWLMDRHGFDDPFGVVAISLVGGCIGMLSVGIISPDASILVQVLAAASIGGIGFGIGASIGLIAWLAGVLCEPPAMATPVVDAA